MTAIVTSPSTGPLLRKDQTSVTFSWSPFHLLIFLVSLRPGAVGKLFATRSDTAQSLLALLTVALLGQCCKLRERSVEDFRNQLDTLVKGEAHGSSEAIGGPEA